MRARLERVKIVQNKDETTYGYSSRVLEDWSMGKLIDGMIRSSCSKEEEKK